MHVVLAKPVTLVAGVDDERVIENAFLFKEIVNALHVVVDGGHAADELVDHVLVGQ